MNNLILAAITFALTVGAELLFHLINGTQMLLPVQNYIGLFIALLLFTLIKKDIVRFIFLALILALSWFQMGHMSYYGMPVYPTAIWLMFTQMNEITGTLTTEFSVVLIPALIVIPALISLYFLNKKFKPKKSLPFLWALFTFYLIYNPARTYMTGNTWGRQPSTQELMGMNTYLSMSYFLGKILPAKLTAKKNSFAPPKISLTPNADGAFGPNIIFIIGESLSANHLSLLGYERETTPFLNTLKDDPNFIYRSGISAGVSTDIAVAFLINNTFGLGGQEDVIKNPRCLFKLAKKNNYKTFYYSSQSQQQLRYITNSICPGKIDHYKNLEIIDPTNTNVDAADDMKLLEGLGFDYKDMNKRFYILHQRGSHAPYALRYPEDKAVFPITGDYKTDRVNHYDNSVLEFDRFMEKLILKIKAQNRPTIVLYVSDHGEGLGEDAVWGHAALKKPSFSIPVLAYFHNTDIRADFSVEPTHLEVTMFLTKLLGFDSDLKFPLKNYQILGNDMDGFAGYLNLEFDESGNLTKYQRQDI